MDRSPTWREQLVGGPVRVKERHSKPPQHCRGSALSHTDRTGEADDDHRDGAKVATIAARSRCVTCTGVPNQASNPGRP